MTGKIKHEVKDVPDGDTTSLDKFHGWSPSSAAADATNTTGHHLLFSGDDTRKHPCVSVLGNLTVPLVFLLQKFFLVLPLLVRSITDAERNFVHLFF